jgi:predicted nuclease of predicted toxin-antitoxin system
VPVRKVCWVIRLLTDENFDGDILRGLVRRMPNLDVVRVQDIGLTETPDPTILAWAAAEERVLLTHDFDTVAGFAYDRVRSGQPMPGVFLVSDQMPKGQAIDELLLAIECYAADDCKDTVHHFPL